MPGQLELFICYSSEDDALRLDLEKHLSRLKWDGIIAIWHQRNISAGTDRQQEVDRHLNAADIILLLISPDFMHSDYLYSVELKRAMQRHVAKEAVVIPVIVRPVDWQNGELRTLSALPSNARAVTSWGNIDDALYDVAKGMRRAIEELIVRRQARKIALFGHELQGGSSSPLWRHPETFSLDETYHVWVATKRAFFSSELTDFHWIKTNNLEHAFLVIFNADGSFTECSLSDPNRSWRGAWEMTVDGMVRMQVSNYELTLIANQESQVHAGIEVEKETGAPHCYLNFFPVLESAENKHWDVASAVRLVKQLTQQIFGQHPDTSLLITYGSLLCRGELSVRAVLKIFALSQRYQERCKLPTMIETYVEGMYQKLLGRKATAKEKALSIQEIKTRGCAVVIADLIDSDEYLRFFGEDALPGREGADEQGSIFKRFIPGQ